MPPTSGIEGASGVFVGERRGSPQNKNRVIYRYGYVELIRESCISCNNALLPVVVVVVSSSSGPTPDPSLF